MSKQARLIQTIGLSIQELIINGMFIRSHAYQEPPDKFTPEAKEILTRNQRNIEVCLANLVENNPEQAEALMAELGYRWNAKGTAENIKP